MTRARTAAMVAAALLASRTAAAQVRTDTTGPGPRLVVRDVGPGVPGRLLRDLLSRPHRVLVAPDTGIVLGRETDVPSTLIVLGGPVRLAGRVRGDVLVIGDLVLRPGAEVEGRAVTIGGLLANSTLAVVHGDRVAFPDVTFRPERTGQGTLALDHESLERSPLPPVSLPGVVGVRIPTYDRVNGVSVAFGPEVALAGGRFRLEPTVTYRSQLGAIDPGVLARWELGRRTWLDARVQRGTLTNDAWIRSDFVNTMTSLFAGSDSRNYYRADRGELTFARQFAGTDVVATPFVGALLERARSAAADSSRVSAPWSLLRRRDRVEGMLRPNPAVSGGTIGAALLGLEVRRLTGAVTAAGTARLELPATAPAGRRFAQMTLDGSVSFPAFRDHTFDAFAHAVATAGDSTPSQRYAYLGGSSTVPTFDPLQQGGDRLVWVEGRYTIPLAFARLPFAGTPRITIRHIVGGAGIGRLPALTQNVGVRLAAAALRVDFMIDPADPARYDVGVGFGFR